MGGLIVYIQVKISSIVITHVGNGCLLRGPVDIHCHFGVLIWTDWSYGDVSSYTAWLTLLRSRKSHDSGRC